MRIFNNRDRKLRLEIAKQAGFAIEEAMLVYEFVKGNDAALSELKEFRQWKKERAKEAICSIL